MSYSCVLQCNRSVRVHVLFSQTFRRFTCRYYSATIIKMSGVKSDDAAVWLSAVTAAVNFAFTFLGLYLVERIGRRPLTIGSLVGESPGVRLCRDANGRGLGCAGGSG